MCIVYDPSRSSQGVLALKALKLTDSFMDLYRNNGLTGEKYGLFSVAHIVLVCTNRFYTTILCCCRLREKKLSWVDIFEEIPVCTLTFSILSYKDEFSLRCFSYLCHR